MIVAQGGHAENSRRMQMTQVASDVADWQSPGYNRSGPILPCRYARPGAAALVVDPN